jgi:xylose dehydrogenase (NAD/NADP)
VAKAFRWGILGAAGINRRVVPGLHLAGHTIAIIGSRDPAKGAEAVAEFRAERTGSYEEVLSATDIDAVYLPLPNGLHKEWAIRAAEAGKHVLCEKPMATTVADCDEMVAASQRHSVHLVEAFMYRNHPQWQIAWRAINEGRLGKLLTLRATFQFPSSDPNNVRLSPSLAGGVLQDAGCYCVNVCRWFLGEPTRVRGISLDRQGHGVDTHNVAALEFASGALAILSCSFDTVNVQTVELIGDKGRIEFPTAFVPPAMAKVRVVDANGDRVETVPEANAYALQARAFERLLREGGPVLSPATDAAGTQAVIAAWRA